MNKVMAFLICYGFRIKTDEKGNDCLDLLLLLDQNDAKANDILDILLFLEQKRCKR